MLGGGLDLVVTNGPGTALPVCYCSFLLNKVLLFNIHSKILFVESFCRVSEISLTGKLLAPIADKFVVHWEELHNKYKEHTTFLNRKLV